MKFVPTPEPETAAAHDSLVVRPGLRAHPARLAIGLGGAIAGTLDITYAIVFSASHGIPPMRILQSVASGVLGVAAFSGGAQTAALGLVLHFCIAFLLATIFYLASRRMLFLARRAFLFGPLYGVAIYAVMNLVVLPLSHFPYKPKFPPSVLITGLLVHMFCIGLPIALATRKALLSRA